jgi:hypothetical protein
VKEAIGSEHMDTRRQQGTYAGVKASFLLNRNFLSYSTKIPIKEKVRFIQLFYHKSPAEFVYNKE